MRLQENWIHCCVTTSDTKRQPLVKTRIHTKEIRQKDMSIIQQLSLEAPKAAENLDKGLNYTDWARRQASSAELGNRDDIDGRCVRRWTEFYRLVAFLFSSAHQTSKSFTSFQNEQVASTNSKTLAQKRNSKKPLFEKSTKFWELLKIDLHVAFPAWGTTHCPAMGLCSFYRQHSSFFWTFRQPRWITCHQQLLVDL